jgi:polysaccharide export outer membrane protein
LALWRWSVGSFAVAYSWRPLGAFVVLALSAAIAGCSAGPPAAVDSATFSAAAAVQTATTAGPTPAATAASATTAAIPVSATSFAAATSATSTGKDADYRIEPLDLIEVDVFQVPDLNKTVQVGANGQVSLPLIGEVMAGGKTTHELESAVAAALGAKYLQSPEVSVSIKDAMGQRITVEGSVQHPGIFPTTGQTSLMQVIALAGGLNDIADSKAVIVFRTVGGKRQAAAFDYKAIRTGHLDDPTLRGGDIVAVDESGSKAAWRNIRESLGVANLFVPLAGAL